MRCSIKPRKSLGQNFLHSKGVLDKISRCVSSEPVSGWLEIGCGTGLMTERILETGCPFTGIELDSGLASFLRDRFLPEADDKMSRPVQFVNASFLDVAEEDLHLSDGYGIAGNLPYYLSTPIVERILLKFQRWKVCYFMVQKEFGERMFAAHGSRIFGRLSLFCSYYAEVTKAFDVKRGSFFPVPGVDSVFVCLRKRERLPDKIQEDWFFRLVRQGFSQRRKIARGLLKNLCDEKLLDAAFATTGIEPRSRAEEISLDKWLGLSDFICRRSAFMIAENGGL